MMRWNGVALYLIERERIHLGILLLISVFMLFELFSAVLSSGIIATLCLAISAACKQLECGNLSPQLPQVRIMIDFVRVVRLTRRTRSGHGGLIECYQLCPSRLRKLFLNPPFQATKFQTQCDQKVTRFYESAPEHNKSDGETKEHLRRCQRTTSSTDREPSLAGSRKKVGSFLGSSSYGLCSQVFKRSGCRRKLRGFVSAQQPAPIVSSSRIPTATRPFFWSRHSAHSVDLYK